MTVSIKTNVPSLQAQRRLSESSAALGKTFERLASGLRINRASDDAAGLAIGASLNADNRIISQGIRNLNDGLSLLGIAQAALEELGNINVRQQELAAQAASGTYTVTQRRALDAEANALVDEFNRIVTTTEFNGLNLLGGQLSQVVLQLGRGHQAQISFGLGNELSRQVGDGTFIAGTSYDMITGGYIPADLVFGRFNINKPLALVLAAFIPGGGFMGGYSTIGGMGDGVLTEDNVQGTGPGSIVDLAVGDFNRDGVTDFAALYTLSRRLIVNTGVGDGTFTANLLTNFPVTAGADGVETGDFNNDGNLDIAVANATGRSVNISLGNGNGTFLAPLSTGIGAGAYAVVTGDINSDDTVDLLSFNSTENSYTPLIGRGDGTFTPAASISVTSSTKPALADVNHDGWADMVAGNSASGGLNVMLGRGDGSFSPASSYSTGSAVNTVRLSDLNGDGVLDATVGHTSGTSVGIMLGNADGTFTAAQSMAAGVTGEISFGDLNLDGVADIATAFLTGGDTYVNQYFANTSTVTTMARLDLTTRAGAAAALDNLKVLGEKISSELSAVGSTQSRLSFAGHHLAVMSENYAAAAGRIMHADIAEEAATLVREQILQQAATAILAQANQQPAIVLKLVK